MKSQYFRLRRWIPTSRKFRNRERKPKKKVSRNAIWSAVNVVVTVGTLVTFFVGTPHEKNREARELETANEYYNEAAKLAAQREFKKAIDYVQRGQLIGQRDPYGLYLIQRYDVFRTIEEGTIDRANLNELNGWIERNPDDVEALVNRMIHYKLAAQYGKALIDSKKVITQLMADLASLNEIAVVHLRDALYNESLIHISVGDSAGLNNNLILLDSVYASHRIESITAYRLIIKGLQFNNASMYDSAEDCYQEAIATFRAENVTSGRFQATYYLLQLYINILKPSKALVVADEANTLARELNSRMFQRSVREYEAEAYRLLCRYEEAKEILNTIYLEIYAYGDRESIANNLVLQGNVLIYMKQLDAACLKLNEAVTLYRKLGDQYNLPIALNSLGYAYTLTKDARAIKILNEAKILFTKLRFGIGVINADLNLARADRDIMRNPARALKALKNLRSEADGSPLSLRAEIEMEIGVTFLQLGDLINASHSLSVAHDLSSEDFCLQKQIDGFSLSLTERGVN